MREYRGSAIRNIAVVGHGASGKTSLVEALAFVSGSSKRHGTIADGTTLTDSAPEEIERGYSINLGCAHAEWMDTKINLIDTPGFLDFQGDALAGLAAADGALCVIGATAGVEVGTERMFHEAVSRGDPVLFVAAMKDAMKRMELFPLFCVSSTLNYGTRAVLSTIVELMPSAFEMEELHAFVGAEGDRTVEIHAKDDAPFAALVFKTQSEPHVGD